MREVSMEEQYLRGDLGTVPTSFATSGPKTVPRVDYERIFVVDGREAFLGEYVLRDDCPVEAADLERAKPLSGMRHLVAFYLGEYAFTPFRVDDLWFIVVTRGVPRIEDRASIGTLLAAARVHIVPNLEPALAARESLLKEREREIADRESLLLTREQRVGQLDQQLKVLSTRLRGFESDLRMREAKLTSLRDYAVQMQRMVLDRGGVPGPLKPAAPKAEPEVTPSPK